jgi:ATP-dependent helicase/nuclease subunit B
MSLQLILGSSGSGKSYYLYHKMIEDSFKMEETNFLIIVPEQFTMETQKDLVSMHPNNGIMNIDILSFMRLAYRVFDEIGGNDRPILDDSGKSMILRKVVELKKDELHLFASNVRKKGFIDELKSLMSELFQYSIDEEEIEKMIDIAQSKPMLQGKLGDVLTVYKGFKEYLSEKYITAEEILDVLYDMIADSSLIKNSVICFDGFTGFTPSQYKLLAKLMKLAKKVYITVTIDPREDITRLDEEFKLFYLSKKTILKLYQLAIDAKVEIEKEYYSGKQQTKAPYRFKNSKPLASLEYNLFRYPWKPFEEEQKDIHIHLLKNPKEEVNFTIAKIHKLIREEGYRFRDIAVVSGDIERYGRIIEKEYKNAGLPCFIDNKKDILSNPFVELIRSLLEILRKDFDYESIFRYLRCGLVEICPEDVDILENYTLALGIRGYKRWSEPWVRIYRKEVEIDLEHINQLREEVVEHLKILVEGLAGSGHTVLDYTKNIYEFISSTNAYDQLQSYQIKFEEEGQPILAKEYVQIYRIVMEVFEGLVELLGDEVVNVKEYEELIETGFAQASVGLIPPGVDQITVGDIERTRLKDIKALFFIGVNDGIIPKAGGSGGILSDMEREMLWEHHIELAPTKRQSVYTEQFYLYMNLTKPSSKLYITYSKVGGDGKALRASYLIGKMVKLFPLISIKDEELFKNDIEHILGADKGVSYLINGLREYAYEDMTPEWKELFSWYFKKEDFKEDLIKLVEGAFYTNEKSSISKAIATMLYGSQMTGSVTRLELYAACAFAHFVNFGLELKERQEYKIGVPDMGNIFHNAIELYSKKLKENNLSWQEVSDEQRDDMATMCVKEIAMDFGNTILLSSKRNEYIIFRVERMVKRTLWALSEHMKKGEFMPKGYEVQFSYMQELEATKISLSEGESMGLRGRIDRLDTYEDKDNIFVKVIDYKSGSTTFDVVDLYYGLQLQLVVYLDAAIELEQKNNPDKNVIPAGIFYYNIDDPIVNKTKDANNEILKELRMNGIVNSDVNIIKKLDKSFVGQDGGLNTAVKSLVVPVETTKAGEFTKNSNVIDKKSFQSMKQYVNGKMKEYGRQILSGDTSVNPYKLGDKKACTYCSYSGICGFDKRLPGHNFRNLKKLLKEEVWREINGDDAVDDGPTKGD